MLAATYRRTEEWRAWHLQGWRYWAELGSTRQYSQVVPALLGSTRATWQCLAVLGALGWHWAVHVGAVYSSQGHGGPVPCPRWPSAMPTVAQCHTHSGPVYSSQAAWRDDTVMRRRPQRRACRKRQGVRRVLTWVRGVLYPQRLWLRAKRGGL